MRSQYRWHKVYQTAMLETDPTKMLDHIGVAHGIITVRRKELLETKDFGKEFRDAETALNYLGMVKLDVA